MQTSTGRLFKQVPRILFGRGSFDGLGDLMASYRGDGGVAIVLLDAVHASTGLKQRLKTGNRDLVLDVDTGLEPRTDQVDALREEIQMKMGGVLPCVVVGIGGGSAMDVAKAVSVLLTNHGSSTRYQGWDLVPNKAVPKIGVPTVSGSGAEASRTAVLVTTDKKYGINSNESMFDVVVLDPDLTATVPNDQRFHSGMDCYIHSIESLEGSFINSFGRVYAREALALARKVFLGQGGDAEDLMVASYMGGASVANSEVGVAHALSYGLSLVLGYRHGLANCIAFNQLDEFYPAYVPEFREMMRQNGITLPTGVCDKMSEPDLEKMVQMTLRMERPLTSALGADWKAILTPDRIRLLYGRM